MDGSDRIPSAIFNDTEVKWMIEDIIEDVKNDLVEFDIPADAGLVRLITLNVTMRVLDYVNPEHPIYEKEVKKNDR